MANSPFIYSPTGALSLAKGGVTLPGATSGTLQIQPNSVTASHVLTMPAAQGAPSTVLTNDGSGGLSWAAGGGASTTPTQTIITAQIYTFAVTSFTATAGAVYAQSGGTTLRLYTVVSSVTASSSVVVSSSSPGLTSGTSIPINKVSGTGDTTMNYVSTTSSGGTYTTPGSVKYIKVRMVGGGGGGGASGIASSLGSDGTAGLNSTFGGSLIVAGGGAAGTYGGNSTGPKLGGGFSFSGVSGLGLSGGSGSGAGFYNGAGTDVVGTVGGSGGSSFFGGNGGGGGTVQNTSGDMNGTPGVVNTGSGGGGAGNYQGAAAGEYSGTGGGAGGFVEVIIPTPSSTYSFSLGVGGYGGLPLTSGFTAGNGATGIIIVDEFYS